jgi:hypothetical protein
MNPLLQAWETTVEDVETVLKAHQGDPALAGKLLSELDCRLIAKSALHGFGLAIQTLYAYQEIERQLGLSPTKFSV